MSRELLDIELSPVFREAARLRDSFVSYCAQHDLLVATVIVQLGGSEGEESHSSTAYSACCVSHARDLAEILHERIARDAEGVE